MDYACISGFFFLHCLSLKSMHQGHLMKCIFEYVILLLAADFTHPNLPTVMSFPTTQSSLIQAWMMFSTASFIHPLNNTLLDIWKASPSMQIRWNQSHSWNVSHFSHTQGGRENFLRKRQMLLRKWKKENRF